MPDGCGADERYYGRRLYTTITGQLITTRTGASATRNPDASNADACVHEKIFVRWFFSTAATDQRTSVSSHAGE